MKIGWEEALEAMYGTQVSDKQIPVWEHYLKAENTNSAELVKAIELAAGEGIKAEEWRVTVRDLRKWLKIYRARKYAADNIAETSERIRHFIDEWKSKIERGADKNDFIGVAEKFSNGNTKQFNDICRAVLK